MGDFLSNERTGCPDPKTFTLTIRALSVQVWRRSIKYSRLIIIVNILLAAVYLDRTSQEG